jgi:urease accessory protein
VRQLDRRAARRLAALVPTLATLIPSEVVAHPATVTANAFAGGALHSFGGLDHALAMIGVGVLSTRLSRLDVLFLPLCFLLFLAMGASLGHLGIELRFAETAIAMSCLALGSCILSPGLQRHRRSIFAIVAAFAIVHGNAHAIELPAGFGASRFTLGFLSASAVMHVTGVFIGDAFRGNAHRWLVEIFGSAMVVFGALFLLRSLRAEARVTSSAIESPLNPSAAAHASQVGAAVPHRKAKP